MILFPRVLLVDGDSMSGDVLSAALEAQSLHVDRAPRQAAVVTAQYGVIVVFTNGDDELAFLEVVRSRPRDARPIVITVTPASDNAILRLDPDLVQARIREPIPAEMVAEVIGSCARMMRPRHLTHDREVERLVDPPVLES